MVRSLLIQRPCGTRRASLRKLSLSRRLHPPSAAQVRLRSGKVRSGRAAVCAVQWPARNGAPLRSAPSPSCLHFAALRYVTSATAESAPALRCARQAAGLASTAARSRQSLRLVPRGGSARPAPVGRPAAPVAFAPCGPVRKAGRSRETARLGFVYSAARSPTKLVPLKRLHGRRRCAPAWRLPLCAADRSGLETPLTLRGVETPCAYDSLRRAATRLRLVFRRA